MVLLKRAKKPQHFACVRFKRSFFIYKTFEVTFIMLFLSCFYIFFQWQPVLWLRCDHRYVSVCSLLRSEQPGQRGQSSLKKNLWKHLDESPSMSERQPAIVVWFLHGMLGVRHTHLHAHSHMNDCRSSSASCGSRWSLVNFRRPETETTSTAGQGHYSASGFVFRKSLRMY